MVLLLHNVLVFLPDRYSLYLTKLLYHLLEAQNVLFKAPVRTVQ